MKKIIYFLSLIFGLSLFSWQTFASDSLESFITIDGKHMCSLFNKEEFRPCIAFGTEYDNNNVVTKGNKPFFTTDWLAKYVNGDTTCVKNGKEVENIALCDKTVFKSNDQWSFECIIKNGIETCTKQDDSQWDSVNELDNSQMNSSGTTTSQSTCIVNGKEVDCAEMTEDIASGIGSILKYGAVLWLFWLIWTIFYIWMLVHAISKPIPNKIVWILVIFFLSPIGMIVYYFAIKRKFIEWGVTTNTPPQTVPYAVNVGVTYNEWPITTTPQVQTEQVVQPSPSEPQIVLTNENNTPTPTI